MTVANTILQQLGGARRLTAMTGAHSFTGSADSLTFKVKARALKGIKAIRITLTPADLYTVSFWKIRGTTASVVAEIEGVYFDQLRQIIEHETGLALSL